MGECLLNRPEKFDEGVGLSFICWGFSPRRQYFAKLPFSGTDFQLNLNISYPTKGVLLVGERRQDEGEGDLAYKSINCLNEVLKDNLY